MALIHHNGLAPWAAHACADRAWLHPQLDRLSDEHPDKRWVLAKCVHAMRMEDRQCRAERWWEDAPYHDRDAEAYARRVLMPAGSFRASAQLADKQLAARFRVPIEKVADRRAELHAERAGSHPGQLCAELPPPGPGRHVAGGPAAERRRRRRRRVPRR